MRAFNFNFEYKFHPVGQGLFATGWLGGWTDDHPRFYWVYDCGTVSKQDLLKKAINKLKAEAAPVDKGKPIIDLVTISHFDKDHISGLVSLLSKFSVRTLLLPYMPLWQRMVSAFDEGIDTQQELIQFFINPVAFITELPDVKIEKIVFVPGGNEGPADETNTEPSVSEGREIWELYIDTGTLDEAQKEEKEELEGFASDRTDVKFMKAGSRMRVAGFWEFVPYNDANIFPAPKKAFYNEVEKKRKALLAASKDLARQAALKELRDVYDKHFGNSSEARNLISLFLYAGPIGALSYNHVVCVQWMNHACFDHPNLCRHYTWDEQVWPRKRIGILYTGDGYLNKPDRLNRLINFMGASRIKKLTCLQVMHHGAESNWHEGLAKRFTPDISVFSSDPLHKNFRHPHAPVVRDFLPYGPMQVDKSNGLTIHGYGLNGSRRRTQDYDTYSPMLEKSG